ncbi:MAG: TIGR00282 family metallophosphoesterase [Candidatus Rokubacteria bacterium]|nr:TIGR00282 family metallophosphoesterase [Candidatus Rokubacteria bacterium]
MSVLLVGDVFGEPGRRAVLSLVPALRREHGLDLVIANVENAAAGFGVTPPIARALLDGGVDVLTSGNHVWDKREVLEFIAKENLLLRPANYPPGAPGAGSYVVKAGPLGIAVLNLQGRVFMPTIDCPFRTADALLPQLRAETPVIIVDMHAEATSEKQAMGWYLDGRVSAVMGTHSHVQTADERILPGGTAYLTYVGMTGPVDSVIGVARELAIERFVSGLPNRFEPAKGPAALHGALVRIDPESGKALEIRRLRQLCPV